jgi:hypothetical protein
MWGSFSKFEEFMFALTFWLGTTAILATPVALVWFLIKHLRWV